jgi:O-methyltransferase
MPAGAVAPHEGADAAHASAPTPWVADLTAERMAAIPDSRFYAPLFSPWLGYGDFASFAALARPYSLVSADRCYVLLMLARQALRVPGAWVECGVYKGGTAMLLARVLAEAGRVATLHLFDTFQGMPRTDPSFDMHQAGDYADTSAGAVEARILAVIGDAPVRVDLCAGWIPDTFATAGIGRVALAHVDVDIHRSVIDCCEYLYPRLADGGMLVFDDYGFPTCPGARAAVDEFFRDKPETPLPLHTGQAIVHKLPVAR